MTTINGPYVVDWLSSALLTGQQPQGAAARRQADLQTFLDTSAAIANTFASISQNQVQGMGNLAAQAAVDRLKAATKAKLAEIDKLAAEFKINKKA
jgi:hypothetical protein